MTDQRVRFLDKSKNTAQIELLASWMEECIHMYGVDFIYFRRENDFFVNPTLSSVYSDYIYGESAVAPFNVSGEIIGILEVNADEFLMAQMGMSNLGSSYSIDFMVDGFTESFRHKIGKIDIAPFSGIVSGVVTSGSSVVSVSGDLYSANADISGRTTQLLPLSGELNFLSTMEYALKPVNHRFAIPQFYEGFTPTTGNVSGMLTQIGDIVTGVVSGDIIYHTIPAELSLEEWGIAPQVGDFFRMRDPIEPGIYEEYEITRIRSKNLSEDGMNALLGTYIWKADCVRREPSYENFKDTNNELTELTQPTDKSNLWHNQIQDIKSDDLFDYTEAHTTRDIDITNIDGQDISDVYGGY